MEGEWRNSTYAKYAKISFECRDVLDEMRLLGKPEDGGLGYHVENLSYVSSLVVLYGDPRDIGIKAGEIAIIALATGEFGYAAVALGARVLAMDCNVKVLEKLTALDERVKTVRVTGDLEEEAAELRKFGLANAFFDISPRAAEKSTHIKTCIHLFV